MGQRAGRTAGVQRHDDTEVRAALGIRPSAFTSQLCTFYLDLPLHLFEIWSKLTWSLLTLVDLCRTQIPI